MILVTGGAGFIGSVLVAKLNQLQRYDIVIVDDLGESIKWKNLRHLKFVDYIHADDLFNGDYDELMNEVEVIFHMGAISSTTEKDMDKLYRYNINYSKALLNFAAAKNIQFIYASSAATYGDGDLGYDDSHDKIQSLRPLNPYGFSKQIFDEWILSESVLKPDLWFGLKFFNVYGPNEYHKDEMRSLVHKSFHQIKESKKVKLFKSHKDGFKDGEQLRDFIYVMDVVNVILELSQVLDASKSGIYNLGTGSARSFKDLVIASFDALNISVNIEYIDMPMSIRNQYQYYTEAKMEKLLEVLPGFKFTSLEDGVTDYIKNYLLTTDEYVKGV